MKGKAEILTAFKNSPVPLAAAAKLSALSDGRMGASVARSARIIAALAAVAIWKVVN